MNILVLLTMLVSLGASEAQGTIYPDCGIITEVDGDLFTIEMANGNEFQFTKSESDYELFDLVAVNMYDNGTKSVSDDVILDVKYAGYTQRFQDIELEIVEHEYE